MRRHRVEAVRAHIHALHACPLAMSQAECRKLKGKMSVKSFQRVFFQTAQTMNRPPGSLGEASKVWTYWTSAAVGFWVVVELLGAFKDPHFSGWLGPRLARTSVAGPENCIFCYAATQCYIYSQDQSGILQY